jgi:hypothetical protein
MTTSNSPCNSSNRRNSALIEAIPTVHTASGRKLFHPKKRHATSGTTANGIKMMESFTRLPKSASLPTFPSFGDKLLQSHRGKRRYQRRGSRSPSMFIKHFHPSMIQEDSDTKNISYATDVGQCMIQKQINFNRRHSASAVVLTSLSTGPTTSVLDVEVEAINLTSCQFDDDDNDDDVTMGMVDVTQPAHQRPPPTDSSIESDLDGVALTLLTQALELSSFSPPKHQHSKHHPN